MERTDANNRSVPKFALVLLIILFVAVFTPLAVYSWWQAWHDWQAVPADGMVVNTHMIRYKKPLPRSNGPWHVVWEVQPLAHQDQRVSVIALGSYAQEASGIKASRDDLGRQLTIWHVPGESVGTLDEPDRFRGTFAAIWTTVMAIAGWIGAVGLIKRRLRTSRSRTFAAR